MIKFVSGDFFEFDADIMVNTVNCVGVMGAGVALAFKKRFPEMFEDYVEKCSSGMIRPGLPSVWIQKDMISKEIEIINFPTKDHWKKPSEYNYIDDGLKWLSTYLDNKTGKVVTLPALGCGHGGLDWDRVRNMISDRLQNSPAHIYVFEPYDSVRAGLVKTPLSDYERLLNPVEAGVIKCATNEYPKTLQNYTRKDLYFYPKNKREFKYDFSIICSTKPKESEVNAVRNFIEFCAQEKFSVLFGGTAFEKKLAFEFSAKGLVCGCFLPSGFYESVKKMHSANQQKKPNLLSIGNPIIGFDKKEFLPSVFARMHISNKIIFFSSKLDWLQKHKKKITWSSLNIYYYVSDNSSPEDESAALEIGAKRFDLDLQLRNSFVVKDDS